VKYLQNPICPLKDGQILMLHGHDVGRWVKMRDRSMISVGGKNIRSELHHRFLTHESST
jgi:hypothetical protein